jgi:hypothetical protein
MGATSPAEKRMMRGEPNSISLLAHFRKNWPALAINRAACCPSRRDFRPLRIVGAAVDTKCMHGNPKRRKLDCDCRGDPRQRPLRRYDDFCARLSLRGSSSRFNVLPAAEEKDDRHTRLAFNVLSRLPTLSGSTSISARLVPGLPLSQLKWWRAELAGANRGGERPQSHRRLRWASRLDPRTASASCLNSQQIRRAARPRALPAGGAERAGYSPPQTEPLS